MAKPQPHKSPQNAVKGKAAAAEPTEAVKGQRADAYDTEDEQEKALLAQQRPTREPALHRLFALLDFDGHGYITDARFAQAVQHAESCSVKGWAAAEKGQFAELANGTRRLSRDEFVGRLLELFKAFDDGERAPAAKIALH